MYLKIKAYSIRIAVMPEPPAGQGEHDTPYHVVLDRI